MSKSKRARSIKPRWFQNPIEAGPQSGGPAPQAGSFETGAGADTAASAERGHHRDHHGLHRMAAALGAGFFCGGGAASTDVASGFRPHAACEPEHGPAGFSPIRRTGA